MVVVVVVVTVASAATVVYAHFDAKVDLLYGSDFMAYLMALSVPVII